MKAMLFVVAIAVGCGGGKKKEDTTGGPTIDPNATTGDPTDRSGQMIDDKDIVTIHNLLERKRNQISRCLTMVVDNKELPKGSKGKMTLSIRVAQQGKADKVEVLQSSLESKSLETCVVDHVKSIEFPQIPSTYETTYAYAFEAIQ